jgi:hypothetical protein
MISGEQDGLHHHFLRITCRQKSKKARKHWKDGFLSQLPKATKQKSNVLSDYMCQKKGHTGDLGMYISSCIHF